MQRSVLKQNISRFGKFLALETDETSRQTLRALLSRAARELASLDAASVGVRPGLKMGASDMRDAGAMARFQSDFESSAKPYLLLDPRPGLHIVDTNPAYAAATSIDRAVAAGQRLFDVFPDNPGNPLADGVSNLFNSLRIAAETGRRHIMRIQRYDVRNPDGVFVERYWRLRNKPVISEDGRLLYLLLHLEEVTAEVLRERSDGETDDWDRIGG